MIEKLFEVMRNDLSVMAEYGDDEEALRQELETCGFDILREYADTFLD